MSEAKQRPSVHYGFWSGGYGGYGVSVWSDDIIMADLSAGMPYTHESILKQCGGDKAAARDAICGLAVLAISDGRLMA